MQRSLVIALRELAGIRLAIVFGSLADGKQHRDSDLDLAVDAGRPLSTAEKMALISDLASYTGRPIDLVDLNMIGEPLLGQILRHGKPSGRPCPPHWAARLMPSSRDDYISRSGGLTNRADDDRIYVVRANGSVLANMSSRWFGNDKEIKPGDTIVVPMDVERLRPLTLWTSVSQIVYQFGLAIAAWNTIGVFK